jgi:hypothetical protein
MSIRGILSFWVRMSLRGLLLNNGSGTRSMPSTLQAGDYSAILPSHCMMKMMKTTKTSTERSGSWRKF